MAKKKQKENQKNHMKRDLGTRKIKKSCGFLYVKIQDVVLRKKSKKK